MAWRPRGMDSTKLDALHPGVPMWIRRRVLHWADAVSSTSSFSSFTPPQPDPSIMEEFETRTRRETSLVGVFSREGVSFLFEVMEEDEFLDFLDFLVARVGTLNDELDAAGVEEIHDPLVELESILSDGGSEWRVGSRDGYAALEKRVPEGVSLAATKTIADAGSAGTLLAEAWHSSFGRSPDAEEAYEKSIKAVEEAGAHVVTPNNKRATLGTMIRDMKAQGDWKLDLATSDADVPVKMAEALWKGHESRHGGNGYRKPTQAEAEAAVLLAVPLVQWFSSGALARR